MLFIVSNLTLYAGDDPSESHSYKAEETSSSAFESDYPSRDP